MSGKLNRFILIDISKNLILYHFYSKWDLSHIAMEFTLNSLRRYLFKLKFLRLFSHTLFFIYSLVNDNVTTSDYTFTGYTNKR
jgi:hypothetical protein